MPVSEALACTSWITGENETDYGKRVHNRTFTPRGGWVCVSCLNVSLGLGGGNCQRTSPHTPAVQGPGDPVCS